MSFMIVCVWDAVFNLCFARSKVTMDLTAELFGGRHQAVVLSNRLSTASAMARYF